MKLFDQASHDKIKRDEMISYITSKMAGMDLENIAFVYGLVQGLTED